LPTAPSASVNHSIRRSVALPKASLATARSLSGQAVNHFVDAGRETHAAQDERAQRRGVQPPIEQIAKRASD
ncbi:MAG: hypothetical protein WBF06_15390, partial [Candidatus Acidiferrales bacterium]